MDRLEAVERLAKLRDTGVLTEAEFMQQKNLLINATSIVARPVPIERSPDRLRQTQWEDGRVQYPNRDTAPQIHIHNSNVQHNPTPVYYGRSEKSVVVAYLLWLFLGGLGGHRFYVGRPGSAIVLIILNVLGWATLVVGIGLAFFAIAGIWLFIDLFLIPGMVHERTRLVLAA